MALRMGVGRGAFFKGEEEEEEEEEEESSSSSSRSAWV